MNARDSKRKFQGEKRMCQIQGGKLFRRLANRVKDGMLDSELGCLVLGVKRAHEVFFCVYGHGTIIKHL